MSLEYDFKDKIRNDSIEATMVVGGSGFIGRHLVKRLSEEENSVVSVYHRRLPEPLAHVYPVCSDLSSIDLLAAPLRGVKTVYYLAWENSFISSSDPLHFDLDFSKCSHNISMFNNLLRAMEHAGTQRLIFLSTLGAGRKASTNFLKEKYLAEFAALNSSIPEKLILRSGVVFSESIADDPLLSSISDLMKFPLFYPVPSFKGRLFPINISDLVDILMKLGTLDLTEKSGVFEVSGQDSISVSELFKIIADKYTKGTRIKLSGIFGDKLLPLFEKHHRRGDPTLRPSIRDYLSIEHQLDEQMNINNPLCDVFPTRFKSIREVLKPGSSGLKRVGAA
jgi:NADH dehydrogenase